MELRLAKFSQTVNGSRQPGRNKGVTFFTGPGFSIIGVLFGEEFGKEASITGGVSFGESWLDVGLIVTTGSPANELPITANVGVDWVAGIMSGDLEQIQGMGEATNIAVPAPLPPLLGLPVGVTISGFEDDYGKSNGGQVGAGVGLPVGLSTTATKTTTLTAQELIRNLLCAADPGCL